MFDKKPKFYGEESYKGVKNIEQCDITFKIFDTGHNYHCQLIKGIQTLELDGGETFLIKDWQAQWFPKGDESDDE